MIELAIWGNLSSLTPTNFITSSAHFELSALRSCKSEACAASMPNLPVNLKFKYPGICKKYFVF